MGPLCNAKTLERVVEHVENARALGADIEQFGPKEGLDYPATVLTGVTPQMLIAQQETFGPVAPVIMKVGSIAEAIEIANSSELGLIASLWTRDLATAWRVGEALNTARSTSTKPATTGTSCAVRRYRRQRCRSRASQWVLEAFTERKLLVFDLGDAEHHDRRAEGGWYHPNQRARRLVAKSAFSAVVAAEGSVNVPFACPGVEKKSTSTRPTRRSPNSM